MTNCGICGRKLKGMWGDPGDPLAIDCGGDCLQCMADCGDPDAIAVLKEHGLPYDDYFEKSPPPSVEP